MERLSKEYCRAHQATCVSRQIAHQHCTREGRAQRFEARTQGRRFFSCS
jgi:hypothetical protein